MHDSDLTITQSPADLTADVRHQRAEYGDKIVATLSRQLGWSHFTENVFREIYFLRSCNAAMRRPENWSIFILIHELEITT